MRYAVWTLLPSVLDPVHPSQAYHPEREAHKKPLPVESPLLDPQQEMRKEHLRDKERVPGDLQ